jgi:hypothetical protein
MGRIVPGDHLSMTAELVRQLAKALADELDASRVLIGLNQPKAVRLQTRRFLSGYANGSWRTSIDFILTHTKARSHGAADHMPLWSSNRNDVEASDPERSMPTAFKKTSFNAQSSAK